MFTCEENCISTILKDITISNLHRYAVDDFNTLNNALQLSQDIIEISLIRDINIYKKIKDLNLSPMLTVNYDAKTIVLDKTIQHPIDTRYSFFETLLGVAYLTGNGFFRADIKPNELRKEEREHWDIARRFAAEIMDANIHKNYIQKEFPTHNNTKTPVFCYLLAQEKYKEGLMLHHGAIREAIDSDTKPVILDTDHHMDSISLIKSIVDLTPEENIPHNLEELLIDQASFSQRIFRLKELKEEYGEVPNAQTSYLKKGILLPGTEILLTKDGVSLLRTDINTPEKSQDHSLFQFLTKENITSTPQFATIWKFWKKSNNDFIEYWKGLYGKDYNKFVHPFYNKN